MIIKCPLKYCNRVFKGEGYLLGYLNEHLDKEHSPMNVSLTLAKLAYKIQDEIMKSKNTVNDIDYDHNDYRYTEEDLLEFYKDLIDKR